MRKPIPRLSMTLVFLLFLLLLIVGCTPARRPAPDFMNSEQEREKTNINEQRMEDIDTKNQDLNMGGISPATRREPTNLDMEAEIKEMVGVGDAIVILDENAAYVGIEGEADTEINQVRGMQAEIARRIHIQLPNLERVYITSDSDKVDQLRQYKNELDRGGPQKKLFKEIEGLF